MPKRAVAIPLPKSWPAKVCAAMLHVVSLAKYAAVYTRSWAADSRNARVRLRADKDRLLHEVALLREEIRIKDARMVSLPPHRRPGAVAKNSAALGHIVSISMPAATIAFARKKNGWTTSPLAFNPGPAESPGSTRASVHLPRSVFFKSRFHDQLTHRDPDSILDESLAFAAHGDIL